MINFKKYLPIKIFSIQFGYGWWWGNYVFFNSFAFAIMPLSFHFNYCTYENGSIINDGDTYSWSNSRQEQYKKDKERGM